ncbi:hypothetical protein KIH74_08655 [Kineosporia sp. J2-2]|uniref:Uncharacterized protein n=1 Tax=Kineosporia corallincola TaxID=2835133 RepID=A0ABS5TD31_9ACTN|nr:hypothetical protein [Kineosporia corallincola]MBT0768994.1 hypothetical protein [Kineosporia corallincola]
MVEFYSSAPGVDPAREPEEVGAAFAAPATEAAAQAVVDRLGRVDWSPPWTGDRHRAHVLLFREYLRRSAIWYDFLEPAPPGPPAFRPWLFADLAVLVAPEVRAPAAAVERLRAEWGDRWTGGSRKAAFQAVQWAALIASHHPAHRELAARDDLPPDPYEPVLRFLERGGEGFGLPVNGWVDLGSGSSVRTGPISENLLREPLLDLSDGNLDRLER